MYTCKIKTIKVGECNATGPQCKHINAMERYTSCSVLTPVSIRWGFLKLVSVSTIDISACGAMQESQIKIYINSILTLLWIPKSQAKHHTDRSANDSTILWLASSLWRNICWLTLCPQYTWREQEPIKRREHATLYTAKSKHGCQMYFL